MRVPSWGSTFLGVWLNCMSLLSSLLGRICGWSVCDLSSFGYCLWGLERKVCKKSLGNNNCVLDHITTY